jgi:excisionase family DNA binding protein
MSQRARTDKIVKNTPVVAKKRQRRQRQPSAIPPAKMAYSVVEFAQAIGISRPTVYVMIQRGQLRTVMIGRRRLIPATEIERVLSGAA